LFPSQIYSGRVASYTTRAVEMSRCCIVVAFALFTCGKASGAVAPNPIRKVVGLMQDMQKEIQGEMDKEKALFEKFMCICTEYPAMLSDTVETGKKTIERLAGQLEEEKAEKDQLDQDLKGHNEDKASAEADLGKASNLREKEQTEYESASASGKANVKVLSKMIPAIEKGRAALLEDASAANIPKVQALVEASADVSVEERRQVEAFLSGSSAEGEAVGGSGEVVGILKQMLDEMTRNLADTEKNEEIASASFADLKSAKDEEIGVAADAIESKEKRSGELGVSISRAKDSHEDTQDEMADAQEMLHTLSTQCGAKKQEWEVRIKLRNDEIAAISEAIGILNNDDALEVFKKAVPSALVQDSKAGFLQTRYASSLVANLEKATEILRRAVQLHPDTRVSFLLSSMASKLRGAQKSNEQAPDLSEVVEMVEKMINILKKEQVDDEKKKDWCQTELLKAEKEQKEKQDMMDSTVAALSEADDNVASNAEDMKAMEADIASLDKSVAEATEQRKKEHGEYVEATQLAQVAIKLIGKAKDRLAKFYNKKSDEKSEDSAAASLLQTALRHSHATKRAMPEKLPDLEGPPALKKKNTGGIMGLMDKLVEEMEADSREATHEEKAGQTGYVELMAESAKTRKQYAKSLVEQQGTDAKLKEKIIKLKEKKSLTSTELSNAHTYVAEIHQTCDFVVEHFQERTEARTVEIEGLNSAKSAIAGMQ